MKFRISTQYSPVSRSAKEIVEFIDIDEYLTWDELAIEAANIEKKFEGKEVGSSGEITIAKGDYSETVTITLTELSPEEKAVLAQKAIDARRDPSGFSYGEWKCISQGGTLPSDTAGALGSDIAAVYALPILDANNVEVDRIIESSMATDKVKENVAKDEFKKWLEKRRIEEMSSEDKLEHEAERQRSRYITENGYEDMSPEEKSDLYKRADEIKARLLSEGIPVYQKQEDDEPF